MYNMSVSSVRDCCLSPVLPIVYFIMYLCTYPCVFCIKELFVGLYIVWDFSVCFLLHDMLYECCWVIYYPILMNR